MNDPVLPTRTTIVFPIRDNQILLGMKKRGFGAGWWNGFGGKLENQESFTQNAIREVREEAEIVVADLKLIAMLLFYFEDKLQIISQAFKTTSIVGAPIETDEMKPQWFDLGELPYDKMWPADDLWIDEAISSTSDTPVCRAIYFDKENNFLRLEPLDFLSTTEVFDSISSTIMA